MKMEAIEQARREEKTIQKFVNYWREEIESDPGALLNLLFEIGETKAYLYNRGLIDECDKWIADHRTRTAMARERKGD
jgi:hypothetical protein